MRCVFRRNGARRLRPPLLSSDATPSPRYHHPRQSSSFGNPFGAVLTLGLIGHENNARVGEGLLVFFEVGVFPPARDPTTRRHRRPCHWTHESRVSRGRAPALQKAAAESCPRFFRRSRVSCLLPRPLRLAQGLRGELLRGSASSSRRCWKIRASSPVECAPS